MKNKAFYIFSTIFIAFFGIRAFGQSEIDVITHRILDNNPELKSYRISLAGDLDDERAANTMEGPQLDFEYKIGNRENRWGVGLSQGFEWPGVYTARRKATDARATAFDFLYQSRYKEMELKVKEAILQCLRCREQRQTLDTIALNLEKIYSKVSSEENNDNFTILEIKNLGIQRFLIAKRIDDLDAELASYMLELSKLNGNVVPDWLLADIPVMKLESLDIYLERFNSNDPYLKSQELALKAAKFDISAAKRSGLPGFAIGYIHDYEEKTHFNGFSIGINFPTWSNRSKLKSIQQAAEAIDFTALDYRNSREAEITTLYYSAIRLSKLVNTGKELFDLSYPALLAKSFNMGNSTLSSYIFDLNEYLDARMDYLDLKYSLDEAIISLDVLSK